MNKEYLELVKQLTEIAMEIAKLRAENNLLKEMLKIKNES